MVLAIPGGCGLFSVLQEVLKRGCDKGTRVRLTPIVHSVLQDFRWLATDINHRPTRIAELIPARNPATLGGQDASGLGMGMGGVHCVPLPNGKVHSLLWRSKFGDDVRRQLVTFSNLTGTVTNIDLELAASVAQHEVLAQQVDVHESTIHNLTDNLATMYWQSKGDTSTMGPASRLLRLQALHKRHHRYVPLFDYIPGEANAMSDDCSRR
jgi:hypothetical protein